jgi:hypothetical protein
MPQDRYTRDKLRTLKKIYDTYNLPCKIADLRKYEKWYATNKATLPHNNNRWDNMLLYTRSIINNTSNSNIHALEIERLTKQLEDYKNNPIPAQHKKRSLFSRIFIWCK